MVCIEETYGRDSHPESRSKIRWRHRMTERRLCRIDGWLRMFNKCIAGHVSLKNLKPVGDGSFMDQTIASIAHFVRLCESKNASARGWHGVAQTSAGTYSPLEVAMRFMRRKGYTVDLGYGDCAGIRTFYTVVFPR